ncbi:MAG: DUF5668 domain-containing protein [Butyrivibrio sp.]|nr:DUF5668 domain-containing protein [Butyrivibrio sp.]
MDTNVTNNTNDCSNIIKVHRVGSITTGLTFIVFGTMFILHMFMPFMTYEFIYKLWPIILIGLGIELLLSNAFCKKFVYDKGAIVIMVIMTSFSMIMAMVEYISRHMEIF